MEGIHPQYSKTEEIANALTHGIGIVLSIVGMVFLIHKTGESGDPWYLTSILLYGTSLVLMYSSSTIYHLVQKDKVKQHLRKLDHSAIYLLIAGTYTPFLLVGFRGTSGWVMFAVIWTFAVVGILIKIATRIRSKWVSSIIYLVMGWLAVFIADDMIDNLPETSIMYIVGGGVFYTLGVVFYVWKKLPYHHAIWHLFVLGGSICHFVAIYYIF